MTGIVEESRGIKISYSIFFCIQHSQMKQQRQHKATKQGGFLFFFSLLFMSKIIVWLCPARVWSLYQLKTFLPHYEKLHEGRRDQ